MFSDAETTREGLTSDGFSNQDIFGRDAGKQEEVKSLLTSGVDIEAIRKHLATLPHIYHGGEETWGSPKPPSWTDLDIDTPYQYLETLTGANVKELRFTVRIKGIQTGYTNSDGDDFVEKISLLQEDALSFPLKYKEYLKKKEFLLRYLSDPARHTNEPKKYQPVKYPHDIAPKTYPGFHRDVRCPFSHLNGVVRGRHDEGERDERGQWKRQVRCDGLHMRWNVEKEEYELCSCCGTVGTQPMVPLSESIFSRVVAGSSEAAVISSAVAGIDAACDRADMDEENPLPYCANCKAIKEQLKSGDVSSSRPAQKENSGIVNLAYD